MPTPNPRKRSAPSRKQPARRRKPRRASLWARLTGWSRHLTVAHVVAAGALAFASAAWGSYALAGYGATAVQVLRNDPSVTPVELMGTARMLRKGAWLDLDVLAAELESLGYRASERVSAPGEYARQRGELTMFRRAHLGRFGMRPASKVRVRVRDGRVHAMHDAQGRSLSAFTCEPQRLGAYRAAIQQDRRPLPFDQFPAPLIQAILAAEDERFESHRGIDPLSIARAAWFDITRTGPLQGGSTITQQVIKNRVLSHERTLMRKLREAWLALYVERHVSKQRVIEIYLNSIYLGQRGPVSIVGFPAASLHYFGRDVRDLDLSQIATLAAMIPSPGRYNPRAHPDRARGRRDWVLARMQSLNYIDAKQADAARAEPVLTAPPPADADAMGGLLQVAQRELEKRGWTPQPGRAAARVFTSIEPRIQRAAQSALQATLDELEKQRSSRAPLQGAVVVLRPATGEIAAMVGGRQGTRGGFNRAMDARRQPGSAFKPFVALAAVMEQGWMPHETLEDEQLAIKTSRGTWSPRNNDGEYRGTVTLREAIEQSLNVPMVRAGLAAGPQNIGHWARLCGIQSPLPTTPAVALGTGEVSPLELATGYATLVNLGDRRDPQLVHSVRIGEQASLLQIEAKPHAERAVARAGAYLVLDMMRGVVTHGTGRGLQGVLGGRDAAAKTGTTQSGRDGWFVMATGQAVVVVWVGRDDGKPARLSGSRAALPVVRKMVEQVGDELIAPLPEMPEDLNYFEIDPGTGGLATSRCPAARYELGWVDDPPELCPEHGGSGIRRWWRRMFRRSDDGDVATRRESYPRRIPDSREESRRPGNRSGNRR